MNTNPPQHLKFRFSHNFSGDFCSLSIFVRIGVINKAKMSCFDSKSCLWYDELLDETQTETL